jgi:hypothetical protein
LRLSLTDDVLIGDEVEGEFAGRARGDRARIRPVLGAGDLEHVLALSTRPAQTVCRCDQRIDARS